MSEARAGGALSGAKPDHSEPLVEGLAQELRTYLLGLSGRNLESPSGSGSRLPRHRGLDAYRPARAGGAARAPGRRAAAVRLRGGNPAATAALRRGAGGTARGLRHALPRRSHPRAAGNVQDLRPAWTRGTARGLRTEEHTSELQSLAYLVCRLLLEKKKTQ